MCIKMPKQNIDDIFHGFCYKYAMLRILFGVVILWSKDVNFNFSNRK